MLALQLRCILATGERILVDLVLDAVWCVVHKNCRGVDTGGHLGAGTLKGGEKNGVDQCRLLVLHLLCMFTALAEVWVLVDGARNQARNGRDLLSVGAEDMRETGCESGGGLGRTEVKLANVVAVVESKGSPDLVDGDSLGHSAHVLVESTADEVEIAEDERLLHIEPNCNNVHRVCLCVPLGIVDLDLLGVHEFL